MHFQISQYVYHMLVKGEAVIATLSYMDPEVGAGNCTKIVELLNYTCSMQAPQHKTDLP